MDSGPDLEKILLTIDIPAKYNLALSLVEAAIPIWENYAKDPESLSYFDGVGNSYYIRYQDTAGNYQTLEKEIVRKAIQILKDEKAKPGTHVAGLEEYCVKVKAHMDAIDIWDDPQPQEVDFTLFALYNFIQLFQGKFKGAEESKLHHIIKLAGDVLVSSRVKTLDELLGLLNFSTPDNKKLSESPDQATNI
jgi:hypothetical protein